MTTCSNACSTNCANSLVYTVVDYPLCIREGKDFRLGVRFVDGDGEYIPLLNVQTILFKARYGYRGSVVLELVCEVDDVDSGTFWIPFTAENTTGLGSRSGCAEYKYDIQFTYTDAQTVPYMEGVLTVKSDV